jgi:hypothetical protein
MVGTLGSPPGRLSTSERLVFLAVACAKLVSSVQQRAHLVEVCGLVFDDFHGHLLREALGPSARALHHLAKGALPQEAAHEVPALDRQEVRRRPSPGVGSMS